MVGQELIVFGCVMGSVGGSGSVWVAEGLALAQWRVFDFQEVV